MKHRIFLFLFCVIVLAAPFAHAQGSRAQSEVALRQLEQQLVEAGSHNDWRFWDRMVAPEWTFIDPFGRILDKPAVLAKLKSFRGSVQSAKLYDVQVRFFRDDVAMVSGIATETVTASAKTISIKYRLTDILVYRDAKWLVTASQATLIKDVR